MCLGPFLVQCPFHIIYIVDVIPVMHLSSKIVLHVFNRGRDLRILMAIWVCLWCLQQERSMYDVLCDRVHYPAVERRRCRSLYKEQWQGWQLLHTNGCHLIYPVLFWVWTYRWKQSCSIAFWSSDCADVQNSNVRRSYVPLEEYRHKDVENVTEQLSAGFGRYKRIFLYPWLVQGVKWALKRLGRDDVTK
jgi:hypothetical protein